jgi:raffinose/stachyose/melibiose transport system substrate-binding protein
MSYRPWQGPSRLGSAITAVAALTAVAGTPLGVSGQAPAAPVTLTVWGSPGWSQAEKDVLQAYQDATGNTIQLELPKDAQTVLAKWGAGERPDVMFYFADAAHMATLNPSVNLQDLTDEPFASQQLPSIQEAMRFDGRVYAALWQYPYIFGILYNKPLFTELGLEPPVGIDGVLAACEIIKAQRPDVAPVFAGGGDMWPLQHYVISFNLEFDRDGSFVDGLNTAQAKFTDPAWLTGLQDLDRLLDAGCFNDDLLTATFEQQTHSLTDGVAAMNFNNTYQASVMIENEGADVVDEAVGFAGISHASAAAGLQGSAGIQAPRTGDPVREAAARQMIGWYMLDGYAPFIAAYRDFPVMQGVEAPSDIPQLLQAANTAHVADGLPIFSQRLRADYGDFPTLLNGMAAGQSTPEGVAAAMQAALEKSAQAIGLPGY